jgi:hypothetical protein
MWVGHNSASRALILATDETARMSITGAGNINIATAGARITGDFSNATTANRVMFQNSVTNGSSYIHALPNGTATQSGLIGFNNSDSSNAAFAQIGATSTDIRVVSSITGTTSFLPMTFYTGGSEKARVDISGNVLVGTATSPSGSNNLVVAGAIVSTRINPRTSTTTSTSSLTPDVAAFDQYNITALATTIAINAPIGTPVDGTKLIFRILDNGTSRTLNWNGTYTVIGPTLPASTTAGKMTYVGCIYNSTNTRWDVVAVTTQA